MRFTALKELKDESTGATVLLVDKATVSPLVLPTIRCGDRILVETSDGSDRVLCTVGEQTHRYVICDPIGASVPA